MQKLQKGDLIQNNVQTVQTITIILEKGTHQQKSYGTYGNIMGQMGSKGQNFK